MQSPNLYDIYLLLCVQYCTSDDGQRYCPKHVESYSKNKFEKLVLLIGFITGMYHDARSSECKNGKEIKGFHKMQGMSGLAEEMLGFERSILQGVANNG